MAKINLTDITEASGFSTTINANNALIEAAIENTLSRDGTAPNFVDAAIDMNSYKITNLADGVALQDAVTVNQLTNGIVGTSIDLIGDVTITSVQTGDVLRWNGTQWVNYPDSNYIGGGLDNVVEDTTPQLGGDLDVQSNEINTSTVNGHIDLTANGTGAVRSTGGKPFRAIDAGGTQYMQMWHDGSNGRFAYSGGDVNLASGVWKDMRLQDYAVTSTTYTPTGTTQTVDYTAGNAYQLDLESATGNVTVTLSNPPSTGTYGEIIIRVEQDSTTPRNLVWPASVKWPGGTAPTISTGANAVDIVTLKTWDAGTTWYGDFSQAYA